ncbi:MAG: hypothetical protein FJZ89_09615 [Chloroflexi bacterium]|nr:hypothetical protein [Chloroflexota bacterium]
MTAQTKGEVFELTIAPIPPDTVASVKDELLRYIEETLQEKGLEELLAEGQIQVEIEKPFPTDQVVIVGVTLLSAMALETYKEIILPELKKRFKVWQKRHRKGRAKK